MVEGIVSAIITTHNRLPLLQRAVESVRRQTYPDMELIVVDDASDDGKTEAWCREQEERQAKPNQPFRYIHISKAESRGGNHARNIGILAAKGEYIAFLDDDDAWLPEKTAKQVALIREKNCELVYGGRRLEFIDELGIHFQDERPHPDGDLSKRVLLTCCVSTTSAIFTKKQALFDVGLFDEELRFWQEYELTIRLAQRAPFYCINEPVILYRIDRQDTARLTNKFAGWKKSAEYIYRKHAALYRRLSFSERMEVKRLYCSDAASRAATAGQKTLAKKYRLLEQLFRRLLWGLYMIKDEGFFALFSKLGQKIWTRIKK